MTAGLEQEPGAQPVPRVTPFERRVWAMQRAAWGLVAIVLPAAVAGLLGAGPMARAQAATPDGSLTARYERIQRANRPSPIEWDVPVTPTGSAVLQLDPRALQDFEITATWPPAEAVRVVGDAHELRFAAARGPVRVRMEVQPRTAGRHQVRARAGGGLWLALGIFVLP